MMKQTRRNHILLILFCIILCIMPVPVSAESDDAQADSVVLSTADETTDVADETIESADETAKPVETTVVNQAQTVILPEKKDKETKSFAEQFPIVFSALNEGFLKTLKLFAIALLGALPLGLIISFGSMCKFKPVSYLVKTIVWIVRGSPLMIQLLILFYVPGLLNHQIWDSGESGRFAAAAVAFIINYSCYFSEIFRGGIQGVPKGQQEAGQVLGLTKSQVFVKVTLLQMIKRIVPPMSNEIITLVKDTSLARIISMQELIWAGYSFMKGSHGISGQVWPLFFTAVYYLIFNGILTILFSRLEKRLDYFKV